MAYTALASASLVSFVWRHPLADSAAKAFALPGAAFTFLALATGSLWGKPIWNTWWEWDGRMTSVLVRGSPAFLPWSALSISRLSNIPLSGGTACINLPPFQSSKQAQFIHPK